MKKSIKVVPKKRGRPATGKDPHVAARMPSALIAQVEAWAVANDATRSEAIRRLVELGLTLKSPATETNKAERSSRAHDLATKAVDKMIDPEANPEERNQRKKNLVKGPSEFRESRIDLPKRRT